MLINILFVLQVLIYAVMTILKGPDISASILMAGCLVSMALLEVVKAIRGE